MQHDAEEDVDEPQDERPSQKSVAASSQQLLDDIRSLNDALFRACNHQGLLQHVPRGDLVSLLRLMRYAVDHGRQVLLEEEDTEATGHVTTALVALEASVGILRISTAPCEGGQVSSEEALEAVIECSRFQLQHNILPFHDARLRAAVRPELGGSPDKEAHAAGEEEEGEEPPAAATSSPSKTPGKGRGRGGGRGGARGRGKGRSGGKSFAAMGPRCAANLSYIVQRLADLPPKFAMVFLVSCCGIQVRLLTKHLCSVVLPLNLQYPCGIACDSGPRTSRAEPAVRPSPQRQAPNGHAVPPPAHGHLGADHNPSPRAPSKGHSCHCSCLPGPA